MELLHNSIRSITRETIVVSFLCSLLFSAIARIFIWVLGKVLKHGYAYWITIPLSWCLFIVIFGIMVSPPDNMPDLHPTIEEGTTTNDSSVFLIVSISNTGAPTIATGYGLTASLFSGEVRMGTRKVLTDCFTITYPNGLKDYVYGEDSLINRTAVSPIPRGGQVFGRLRFDFPKIRQSDLAAAGVKFTLTFRDIFGKTYSAVLVNSSSVTGEGGLLEYSTIHPRTVAPPSPPCTVSSSLKKKI